MIEYFTSTSCISILNFVVHSYDEKNAPRQEAGTPLQSLQTCLKICNSPLLKVHVIKVKKGKIRPWLREMYSKINVGKDM